MTLPTVQKPPRDQLSESICPSPTPSFTGLRSTIMSCKFKVSNVPMDVAMPGDAHPAPHVSSFVCVVRTLKICSLSHFQRHSTVLSTAATTLPVTPEARLPGNLCRSINASHFPPPSALGSSSLCVGFALPVFHISHVLLNSLGLCLHVLLLLKCFLLFNFKFP